MRKGVDDENGKIILRHKIRGKKYVDFFLYVYIFTFMCE